MPDLPINPLPPDYFGGDLAPPDTVTSVAGRVPAAVNQPPSGGTHYPFIRPQAVADRLLADLWLSYPGERAPGYRVAWMGGFGDGPAQVTGAFPVTAARPELIVVDSLGRVVIDTTEAGTTFRSTVWSQRFSTLQWVQGPRVLRATRHWALAPGEPRVYPVAATFTDGELDPRTVSRAPDRVTSLRVGGDRFAAGDVEIAGGYNTALTVGEAEAGVRGTTPVTLAMEPGGGLGLHPGCGEGATPVRRINGEGPDDAGNLFLSDGDCYRLQRPAELVPGSQPPRLRLRHPDLTDEAAAASLAIFNDCTPCCECDDFLAVFAGINRLSDRLRGAGRAAEAARDQFADNREQWAQAAACRLHRPLRLQARGDQACRTTLGLSFCNISGCCLRNVTLRLTVRVFANGTEIVDPALRPGCQQTVQSGGDTDYRETAFTFDGVHPEYIVTFDRVEPQRVVYARTVLRQPGCDPGHVVKVAATVHIPPGSNNLTGCQIPSPDQVVIPPEVLAAWDSDAARTTARYIVEQEVVLDPDDPCDCPT